MRFRVTSPPTETRLRLDDLGTLVVKTWSGETFDAAMPHLPGSTPGDGENGPEATQAAVTVEPEAPAAFTGDTETLTCAAHVLLPTRSLRA